MIIRLVHGTRVGRKEARRGSALSTVTHNVGDDIPAKLPKQFEKYTIFSFQVS